MSTNKPPKWPHHRNLRNRPPTPSKGRGPVQVRIRRAFIASGAEVLSSTQIYDWTHSRRRQSRRKKLPFGVYWRTLKTLRAMCDPIERDPPPARRYVIAQAPQPRAMRRHAFDRLTHRSERLERPPINPNGSFLRRDCRRRECVQS